jgi:hypothetical protein
LTAQSTQSTLNSTIIPITNGPGHGCHAWTGPSGRPRLHFLPNITSSSPGQEKAKHLLRLMCMPVRERGLFKISFGANNDNRNKAFCIHVLVPSLRRLSRMCEWIPYTPAFEPSSIYAYYCHGMVPPPFVFEAGISPVVKRRFGWCNPSCSLLSNGRAQTLHCQISVKQCAIMDVHTNGEVRKPSSLFTQVRRVGRQL